jgi:hypothetical protein
VLYVELTEEEERLALATLDPMSALALTDGRKLADLLDDVAVDSPALGELIEHLQEDAATSTLGEGSDSRLADRDTLVKMVLSVSDIALVEKAIGATGTINRGEALTAICVEYLEKRQHDAAAEGQSTARASKRNSVSGRH